MFRPILRLKYERLAHGWSQGKAATLAHIPQPTLSLIEAARLIPTPKELDRLADGFQLPPDVLLKPVAVVTPEQMAVPSAAMLNSSRSQTRQRLSCGFSSCTTADSGLRPSRNVSQSKMQPHPKPFEAKDGAPTVPRMGTVYCTSHSHPRDLPWRFAAGTRRRNATTGASGHPLTGQSRNGCALQSNICASCRKHSGDEWRPDVPSRKNGPHGSLVADCRDDHRRLRR